MREWQALVADIGHLTSVVQNGTIVGKLFFSLSGLADRFRAPSLSVLASITVVLFKSLLCLAAQGDAQRRAVSLTRGYFTRRHLPHRQEAAPVLGVPGGGCALPLRAGTSTLGTSLRHGWQ